MRISRTWLYLNVYALTLNALFLSLAVFKVWPVILPLAAFGVILAGLVNLSYEINKAARRQQR